MGYRVNLRLAPNLTGKENISDEDRTAVLSHARPTLYRVAIKAGFYSNVVACSLIM